MKAEENTKVFQFACIVLFFHCVLIIKPYNFKMFPLFSSGKSMEPKAVKPWYEFSLKVCERGQHSNSWRHGFIKAQLAVVFSLTIRFSHSWMFFKSIHCCRCLGLNWKINIRYPLCRISLVLPWCRLSQKRKEEQQNHPGRCGGGRLMSRGSKEGTLDSLLLELMQINHGRKKMWKWEDGGRTLEKSGDS